MKKINVLHVKLVVTQMIMGPHVHAFKIVRLLIPITNVRNASLDIILPLIMNPAIKLSIVQIQMLIIKKHVKHAKKVVILIVMDYAFVFQDVKL